MDYSKGSNARRSKMEVIVCLKGNSVMYSNISQKTIALLVTEAKLSAEVMIVQDMMFLYHVIMPLAPKATLPMKL